VAAPKFLRRVARKLKRLQQALFRKTKDSNRRKKAVVNLPAPRGEAVTHPDVACSTRSVKGISIL
jgi:hypothetical protein